MRHIRNAYKYPYLTDLINNGGGLSIEHIDEIKTTAVAFDEGGAIWKGEADYDSIEALLNDAEAGIKRWANENG